MTHVNLSQTHLRLICKIRGTSPEELQPQLFEDDFWRTGVLDQLCRGKERLLYCEMVDSIWKTQQSLILLYKVSLQLLKPQAQLT